MKKAIAFISTLALCLSFFGIFMLSAVSPESGSIQSFDLNGLTNRSGMQVAYGVVKDGFTCTKVEKDDSLNWRGLYLSGGCSIDLSVYKYIVLDCYYEYTDGVMPTGSPLFNAITIDGDSGKGKPLSPAERDTGYVSGKQPLVVNRWNHFVFSLSQIDSQYQSITYGGFQFCSQDHYGDNSADYRVYIRSIKAVASLEDAVNDTVVYRGTQGSVSLVVGSTQNIRFLATIDEIETTYSKVGMEITATISQNLRNWDISSNQVYTAVLGMGNSETYSAADLSGKYLIAVELNNVPVGEEIVFTVTPYILDKNRGKIYGGSYKVKYGEDGQYQDTGSMDTDQVQFVNPTYLSNLDTIAKTKKDAILSAVSDVSHVIGTTYYVSTNGNDANDGKTPQTAWKSVSKVNSANLIAGDAVLFQRGGMWRGGIIGKSGVTYSNYGEGALPILNGSARNYADPTLWVETGVSNVYRCTQTLENVGIMAFDHTLSEIGKYDERVGKILFHDSRDTAWYEHLGKDRLDARDLDEDLEFYSDIANKTLYLYSENGNPGVRFSSIEIGENTFLFKLGADWCGHDITIDGLHFRYCGAHAVNGGGNGSANITVRNSVFAYVGGSVMDYNASTGKATALFGNAIQIYGHTENLNVENNWCYQIYDTGITFQTSSRADSDVNYRNIQIVNNLVEYCHWSIEYYNQKSTTRERTIKDVRIAGNMCRFGGMGWGTQYRREIYTESMARSASAALLCSWGVTDNTENFNVTNNIFDRCSGWLGLIYLPTPGSGNEFGDKKISFSGNILVQNLSESFIRTYGTTYLAKNSVIAVKNTLGDATAKIILVLDKQ